MTKPEAAKRKPVRKPRSRSVKDDTPQVWPESAEQLVPGKLAYATVYWVVGNLPSTSRSRNEVKDPPNAGYSSCFVLPQGGRRVRLFCPYTLEGYTVTSDSMEFKSLTAPRQRVRRTWMRELLYRNWAQFQGYGFQRDYETAARIMREMKWEVPIRAVPEPVEGVEVKKKGKPAGAKLLKPVPKDSRRGQVLSWFMESFEPRSILEAMAEFNTTRSNILTVLFQLNKDHGFGYTLAGDAAEVELPSKGCEKIFC